LPRVDLLSNRRGRRLFFALLYLAEGAPIGYVWWALPTRLRDAGVPIEDVTRISALVTLPWACKFLWAPLVDALRPARMGLRAWIAGAQWAMGLTLLPVIGLDPASQIDLLLAALLLHAFTAATQDVAIDALAVASIPTHELGAMTGWMQVGMLAGRAIFGGVALAAERWVGPGIVVAALIGFVWASSVVVWLARSPGRSPLPRPARAHPFAVFARRLREVLARRATWLGLAIAIIAGCAMEATGAVAGPMLIDRGFAKETVGHFFALPAVLAMGLGALVGGRLSDRRRRDLGLGVAIAALALGVLVVAAASSSASPEAPWRLFASLTGVYALFGAYTASAYALLMELTDPRLGGTQFSAYMSGVNLCNVWSAWAVGRLAAQVGYSSALVAMAIASLLALPALAALRGSSAPREAASDPATTSSAPIQPPQDSV